MSLDKKYISQLRKQIHQDALFRREVIKYAGDALHHAKRAIFALHRQDVKEAEKKLAESETLFSQLHKKLRRHPHMFSEGSYRAALEEYVEASLMHQFVTRGNIGKITKFDIPSDVYLAGLADVPGELYRYAIRAATNGDRDMVEVCERMSSRVVAELMEFDVTKYLRNKFDQAKSAHQKLEIILYELAIRESEKEQS